MVAGIGEPLDLLTALYCPDDEEPAETVLARLSVDPLGNLCKSHWLVNVI
jgi:hypothetical protein